MPDISTEKTCFYCGRTKYREVKAIDRVCWRCVDTITAFLKNPQPAVAFVLERAGARPRRYRAEGGA